MNKWVDLYLFILYLKNNYNEVPKYYAFKTYYIFDEF